MYYPIPGLPGYEINTNGEVISKRQPNNQGKVLIPHNNKAGYGRYKLSVAIGVSKNFLAHRLVAMTFLPNPENKDTVNHIDGNKQNNRVENLEWSTSKENTLHAVRTGLSRWPTGDSNFNTKLTVEQVLKIRELRCAGVTYKELSKQFGVSFGSLWSIVKRESWKHVA